MEIFSQILKRKGENDIRRSRQKRIQERTLGEISHSTNQSQSIGDFLAGRELQTPELFKTPDHRHNKKRGPREI